MNETRQAIDIGSRIGRLTVVERTNLRRQGRTVWRCRCDCGRELLLDTLTLQGGRLTSCGCEGRSRAGETPAAGIRPASKSAKNLAGRRFGSLTVLSYDGKRDGQHYWRCRCDCGNETVVRQTNLQSGHTRSCGCVRRSTYKDNLRLVDGTSVTMIENRRQSTIKTNRSGCNGVYRNNRSGLWVAQITFKGKTYYLGSYALLEDAVKARRDGEEMYDRFLDWYYDDFLKSRAPAPAAKA